MDNKAIGGYFELETPTGGSGYFGDHFITLNSARNCLEYLLRSQKKNEDIHSLLYL